MRLADEWAAFLPSGTLESFRADLGLSYAQAGTVLALIAPGALLGSAFSAAADRVSRRAIAAGGALACAASLAMFAASDSFAHLAAAALVLGAGSTAMVDAAEVALVEMVDDLRHYLARSNLLGTVGGLAGPVLLIAVTAAGFSWRAAFGVGSGVLALYGVALAGAPLPRPPRPAAAEGTQRAGLVAVVRDPAVWVVGLIGLAMNQFDEPLVAFTIALLHQDRGASATVATGVALLGMSGGLLSYTVLARRLAGVGDHRLLVGSMAVMASGALATALVPVVALVAVAALVTSIGLNLGWLALQHRSLTLRPGQVGTTGAVLTAIETMGFWLPVAVGAVADRAGLVTAVAGYGILGGALVALAWFDSGWARRR